DAIRGLLARIEAAGDDEDGRDFGELLGRLVTLQTATPAAAGVADASTKKATPRTQPPARPVAAEGALDAGPAGGAQSAAGAQAESTAATKAVPQRRARPSAADPGPLAAASPPVATPKSPPVAAASPSGGNKAVPGGPAAVDGTPAGPTGPAAGDRTVRVDVELLDSLMRQVGELVLARNQLFSHAQEFKDGGRALQRLSLIVSELQAGVMRTRMQPVEQLWSKLPRVVRDLATQAGKEVTLSLSGGETELDRSVLEAVKDPLTHLVRNAVDHGLEAPELRMAEGKPRAGTLTLKASHAGGLVVLEMSDDGAGIDPQRVGAKAVQRELITEAQLATMSNRDLIDLVFRPGLSTAEAITNVSGRGVGMDVVRTNIENIGGTVDLISTLGEGTTIRIKIPLTLAIIPALLVTCGGGTFAVPQSAVRELVRLDSTGLRTQVEDVDGALIYRLRGRLLPLICLDQVFGEVRRPLAEREMLDVVVVQADGEPFGLAVDAIQGTQEIVVKPLAQHLKQLSVFAGATILGDGNVALILDVAGIARSSGIAEARAATTADDAGAGSDRAQQLLVLQVGAERRVAIPLDQVARLEEVNADDVEYAGSRRTIQYRGDLLPLAWLEEVLGVPGALTETARLPVIVCSDGQHSVGLIAQRIIDVVTEVVHLSAVGKAPGVLGTAVLQGRATDMLDLPVAAWHAGVPFPRTVDLSAEASEEMNANAA
ncbi:MAG: chemotaxis protein CheW, partial [Acidimicrobiales bacterium]